MEEVLHLHRVEIKFAQVAKFLTILETLARRVGFEHGRKFIIQRRLLQILIMDSNPSSLWRPVFYTMDHAALNCNDRSWASKSLPADSCGDHLGKKSSQES